MTTITIPRETFDLMQRALENIAGDKWPDPEMTAEEYAREALSEAKIVQPQASEPEKSLHELLRMGAEENEQLKAQLAGMEKLLRFKEAMDASEPAWMPIETAPKDGTAILGCWPSYIGGKAAITTCQYLGRYWVTTDYMHTEVAEPIYWMPLPAAPEATK